MQVTRRLVGTGSGAPLGVACVDPIPDPERAFVVAMGFGACLEPFELQRFGVLAAALQARLLVVETPGFSLTRTALLANERRALLRADFRPVAARMLAAALSLDHTRSLDHTCHEHRPLSVIGYSMGASLAAAMAGVAHNQSQSTVRLESVVLVEPVANQRWSVRHLLAAMRAEDKLIDGYLRTNEDIPGAVMPTDRIPGAPSPRQRRLDLLLLTNALRAGRLVDDVRAAAAGHHDLKVVVAHGASSRLSQMASCQRMVHQCRNTGISVQDVVVPGNHGLWQSLPAVDDLAQKITRTLRDQN
jgi:pimeloyl-ACP methyl ester carboxylesterase